MSTPRRSIGSTFMIPLGDNGEKTRLNFWDRHAEALPVSLLQITGWIEESPERWVVVPDGNGGQTAVKASELQLGDKSRQVLFRIPEDLRGRDEWRQVLFYLRLEQGRRKSADAHVQRAKQRAKDADAHLATFEEPFYAAKNLAMDAERRARATTGLPEAERLEAFAELQDRVEECRAIRSRWRVAHRRSTDAHGMVDYWAQQASTPVYPGLRAMINSFLDMQALSVASLASDEFRRRGRRNRPIPAPPDERVEAIESGP